MGDMGREARDRPGLTIRAGYVLVSPLSRTRISRRCGQRGPAGWGAGHGARMLNVLRWILALFVAVLIIGPPLIAYRLQYIHAKRFREVIPGRIYRSGQMTASGFRDAVDRYHIKTVINLQH